jgi:hypothetical protein
MPLALAQCQLDKAPEPPVCYQDAHQAQVCAPKVLGVYPSLTALCAQRCASRIAGSFLQQLTGKSRSSAYCMPRYPGTFSCTHSHLNNKCVVMQWMPSCLVQGPVRR